jgi:hypothetical protein
MTVSKEALTNPVAKAAITALEKGNLKEWLELFTREAELYDDGHATDFIRFSENALGHERFKSIDKVESNGLDIYGHFHSDKWGDFKTYFKFHINAEGKIYRLDIGQADY